MKQARPKKAGIGRKRNSGTGSATSASSTSSMTSCSSSSSTPAGSRSPNKIEMKRKGASKRPKRASKRTRFLWCRVVHKSDRMRVELIEGIQALLRSRLATLDPKRFLHDPQHTKDIKLDLDAAHNDGPRYRSRGNWHVISGTSYVHCVSSEHYLVVRVWGRVDITIFYS